jgi:hypothetical protein
MPDFSPRARVIRDAVIYTPLFLLVLAMLLLMVAGIWDRAPVAMVLLAVVGFLFGYQSIQSLRDLREQPQTVSGVVERRWTKRDAFVAKSHYIAVNKGIFRIPIESYLDVKQGDTVTVVAYPHTGTVVSVDRTERTEPVEEPKAPAPAAPTAPAAAATGRMRTLRSTRSTPRASERRDAPDHASQQDPPADA